MITKVELPVMWERVKRCNFCGREFAASALGFEENPYCTRCLPERIAKSAEGAGLVSWIKVGEYLNPVDLSRQKPQ